MQLLSELISLIFQYTKEYIYFVKQNNLICTSLLHVALEDKYHNVELNRKRVMLNRKDNLPWVIYISFKNMNEKNIPVRVRVSKMEIYGIVLYCFITIKHILVSK